MRSIAYGDIASDPEWPITTQNTQFLF